MTPATLSPAARSRSGGSRVLAISGGEPSGNVGGDAARRIRSSECEVVRGKNWGARAAEDAVPDDLCRHQSREPRGHDAVESRQLMATVYSVRELLEPERR